MRDPRSSGADDDTYKTSYTYDLNNRLTRIDYPDGTFETTSYDPNGNILTTTDRKGQITTYQYDNNNRTMKIIHPDQTTTEYAFDAAGRMIGRKYPDGSSTYYETLGNPVESHISREYRVAGDGSLIYDYYSEFDSKGRLIKFLDSTEAAIVKFNNVKYNETINKIGYTPASTLGHHFTYGRQTEGGVPHRTYRQGTPEDPRIAWGKIKFGTRGIQYASAPGVLITSYSYDDNNAMSMTDPFGKTYRLESTGDTNRLYYPNGTYTEKHFNRFGIADTITIKRTESDGSETVLESIAYQFDTVGNITKKTFFNGEYLQYSYDSMGRLTAEERKTASDGRIYKIEYLYDNVQSRIGNMHKVIVNETDITTFDYNEMSELISVIYPDSSVESLTYDDNGNLIQSVNQSSLQTENYEYDCFDRIKRVSLVETENAGYSEFAEFSHNYDGEIINVRYPDMNIEIKQSYNRLGRRTVKVIKSNSEELLEDTFTSYIVFFGDQLVCKYGDSPDTGGTSRNTGKCNDERYFYCDVYGKTIITADRQGRITSKILQDSYGNVFPISKDSKNLEESIEKTDKNSIYLNKIKRLSILGALFSSSKRRFESTKLEMVTKQQRFSVRMPTSQKELAYANSCNVPKSDKLASSERENSSVNEIDLLQLSGSLLRVGRICPKSSDLAVKLMKNNSLRFFTDSSLSKKTKMQTIPNKFDAFLPANIEYHIKINNSAQASFWDARIYAPDDFAIVLAHEMVHVKDYYDFDRQHFFDDFYTTTVANGVSDSVDKECEGVPIRKIVTEYRAYYIAMQLALRTKNDSVYREAHGYYIFYRDLLFSKDKNCCKNIKEGYKKDVVFEDYC